MRNARRTRVIARASARSNLVLMGLLRFARNDGLRGLLGFLRNDFNYNQNEVGSVDMLPLKLCSNAK